MRMGEVIRDGVPGQMDAFHAPSILVRSDGTLRPKDDVRFLDDPPTRVEVCGPADRHGVVDPLLPGPIAPGQLVWVVMEAKFIVGVLSHHFQVKLPIGRPTRPTVEARPAAVVEALRTIRETSQGVEPPIDPNAIRVVQGESAFLPAFTTSPAPAPASEPKSHGDHFGGGDQVGRTFFTAPAHLQGVIEVPPQPPTVTVPPVATPTDAKAATPDDDDDDNDDKEDGDGDGECSGNFCGDGGDDDEGLDCNQRPPCV